MEPQHTPPNLGDFILDTGLLDESVGVRLRLPAPRYARSFTRQVSLAPDLAELTTPYRNGWDEAASARYIQMAERELADKTAIRLFVHTEAAGDEPIGLAELYEIRWPDSLAVVGITIWLPTNRRRGVGRSTLTLLLSLARRLDLTKLQARIIDGNTASITLFSSCGFQFEATFLQHLKVSERFRDLHVYSRIER